MASEEDLPLPTILRIDPVGGSAGPVLYWRFGGPMRSISSAIVGGGIVRSEWLLSVTVPSDYDRLDPQVHIAEVANLVGLSGIGIGLLTAVDVSSFSVGKCDGAFVYATVGVRRPVWAFDPHEPLPDREPDPQPGTINLVCYVNERLSDAALVNAVTTITEAKTQALAERSVLGTGTASDAVAVLCPHAKVREDAKFCGPRSYWGARLARATYEAVALGVDRQRR
jgi:adenosylcobinamide hydrolase